MEMIAIQFIWVTSAYTLNIRLFSAFQHWSINEPNLKTKAEKLTEKEGGMQVRMSDQNRVAVIKRGGKTMTTTDKKKEKKCVWQLYCPCKYAHVLPGVTRRSVYYCMCMHTCLFVLCPFELSDGRRKRSTTHSMASNNPLYVNYKTECVYSMNTT